MSTQVPPYIPPHLQGKVDDFREDSPGSVSFRDESRGNGLFGDRGARRSIDQNTYRATFDDSYRRRHLEESVLKQYGAPTLSESPQEKITNMISGGIGKAWQAGTSNQAKSMLTVGLLSALAGGGAGALYSRRNEEPVMPRSATWAAIAGLLGAGGLYASQQMHNTRENNLMTKMASTDKVLDAIKKDSSLSASEKEKLIAAVETLDNSKQQELSVMLGLGGAAAGTLVAKFLKSKGLFFPIIGTILGVATSRVQFSKLNNLGRPSK